MKTTRKSLLFTLVISTILIFFTSLSSAERRGATTAPDGFCCYKGQVLPATDPQCRKKGVQLYKNRDEALKNCKISKPKEIVKKPKSKRGQGAEAKIKRKPKKVYCCLKGKINEVFLGECKNKKGTPYRTEKEADDNCGWCCDEKRVFPTNDSCSNKKEKFFTTRFQADQLCRKRPQCCIDGELFTYSKFECDNRKRGKYYNSHRVAKKQCRAERTQLSLSKQKAMVTSQATLRVPGSPGPDPDSLMPVDGGDPAPVIVVISRTITPQSPNIGQEVTASFTVKNVGSVATSGPLPFVKKIYASDENGIQTGGATSIYRWHINQLEPGAEQTVSSFYTVHNVGLYASSIVFSRQGNSVPGGYSGEIVYPSEPTYFFFQLVQPYDLGYWGLDNGRVVPHGITGGISIGIKNYGPDIPQSQHDRLGLFLSVNNGNWQTMPMKTIDPNGNLTFSGGTVTFIWPKGGSTNNKFEYRFMISVLAENGLGPKSNTNTFDSHPSNNHMQVTVGGYNDLVVCFKKYVYHNKPYRFRYYDVKVKNIGNLRSDFAVLEFYIEKKGTKTYSIPRLYPGGEHSITRKVYWGTKGIRKFKLNVKNTGNIEEAAMREYPFNNTFKGKIYIKKDPPGPGIVQCSDHPDAANLW